MSSGAPKVDVHNVVHNEDKSKTITFSYFLFSSKIKARYEPSDSKQMFDICLLDIISVQRT